MGERRSTSRSRDLGIELAKIRRAARLNAQAIADALACAVSKVSRIEKGKLGIEDAELIAWLHLCGALPHMQRLLELNHESSKDSWLQPINPWGGRTVIAEEMRATTITYYQPNHIPGLLQTKAYIRAFVNDEELVQLRLERQQVLRKRASLVANFFIEEQALRRPVGGPAAMREQLDHLLNRTRWKRIAIRVVPTNVGAHYGLIGGFVLFNNPQNQPVVYTDMAVANVFFENPADIRTYEEIIKSLDRVALGEEESRLLISKVREDFDDSAGDLV